MRDRPSRGRTGARTQVRTAPRGSRADALGLRDGRQPPSRSRCSRKRCPEFPQRYSALRARTLCAISVHLWYDGQSVRRLALAEQALALATEAGDRETTIARAAREAPRAPAARHARRAHPRRVAGAARGRALPQPFAALSDSLTWRAVDLLEAGDMRAAQRDVDTFERIATCGTPAAVPGIPGPLARACARRWAAASTRRNDTSRTCAAQCAAATIRNAEAYSGLQLAALRLEQGRAREVEELLAVAEPWLARFRERCQPGARCARSRRAGERPRRERRAACSRKRAADDWAELARDPEMIGSVGWLAEACARLGDARARRAALRARPARGSTINRRSTRSRVAARWRATWACSPARRAASTRRSTASSRRSSRIAQIDADLYAAWTLWDHAETLALRAAPGDAERACAFAREASETAERLGLGPPARRDRGVPPARPRLGRRQLRARRLRVGSRGARLVDWAGREHTRFPCAARS